MKDVLSQSRAGTAVVDGKYVFHCHRAPLLLSVAFCLSVLQRS